MMELAEGLSDLGHEVEVYALPYTLEGKRRRDRKSIYHGKVRYHERPVSVVRADVAYYMYHPFARYNFLTRAPKVASFHSQIWFNRKRSKYGVVPRVAAWLSDSMMAHELSHYDAVQVHYPSVAREVDSRAPHHPPLYTIEHFLDTEVFSPKGERPSDKFRVGFVGRPVWQKGFDLFVRLAHEVAGNGIEFFFVGGHVDDDRVKSMGLVNDPRSLAELYNRAHLIVSPQRVEKTVGKSVLESLSCGTPVAVMSEWVDPPLGSCESLMTTSTYGELKQLVNASFEGWRAGGFDQERYTRAARDCIVTNYSLSATIRRYERMLSDVAFGP